MDFPCYCTIRPKFCFSSVDWTLTDAHNSPFELLANGELVIRWTNLTEGNYTIQLVSPDGNSVINLNIRVDVPPTVYDILHPITATNVAVGTEVYQIPANMSTVSTGKCVLAQLHSMMTELVYMEVIQAYGRKRGRAAQSFLPNILDSQIGKV